MDAVCVSRARSLDRMKPQIVLALASLSIGRSLAQSTAPESDTEISKQIENPVTRRITLRLRYEADFLDSPCKATKNIFSINQAVVPFRLDEEWADHPDQAACRGPAAEEARRALVVRPQQRVHDILFVASIWPRFLLGRRPRFSLSDGDEFGARGRQMGDGPIGGLPEAGRVAVGVRRRRQQHPGLSAARPATTGPTSCCSTRSSPIISPMAGTSARRQTSRPTGSPMAENGPCRSAAALARRPSSAGSR